MGKLLFFLLAAIVGWLLFKGVLGKAGARKKSSESPPAVEKMIQCDLCGVHMPESDTVVSDDGKRTCRNPAQCVHRNGK